jgi:hypothetical protein
VREIGVERVAPFLPVSFRIVHCMGIWVFESEGFSAEIDIAITVLCYLPFPVQHQKSPALRYGTVPFIQ